MMFLDQRSWISALKSKLTSGRSTLNFLEKFGIFCPKNKHCPLDAPHDLPRFRVHNNLCVALYNGGLGGGGSHNIPKMWGWTLLTPSPPRPHIICAHSCYWRQYKSICVLSSFPLSALVVIHPFLKKKKDGWCPDTLDPC
jgi:hypothetical protein